MNKPLAFRMRPKTLEEVIGQEKLVGPTGFFTHCVEQNVYRFIPPFWPTRHRQDNHSRGLC